MKPTSQARDSPTQQREAGSDQQSAISRYFRGWSKIPWSGIREWGGLALGTVGTVVSIVALSRVHRSTVLEREDKVQLLLYEAWDKLGGEPGTVFIEELPADAKDQERREEARQLLERVLLLDPGHPEAHATLAMYFLAERQPETALRDACRAVEADPNSATAFAVLGRVLSHHEDAKWRVCAFRRAVEREDLDDDPHCSHYNLGVALYSAGMKEDALEAFRQDAAHGGDPAATHYNIAVLLDELGYPSDAVLGEFQQVIIRDSQDADTHSAMAALLEELGDEERARWHRDEVSRLAGDTVEGSGRHYPPLLERMVSGGFSCMSQVECTRD